MSAEMEQAVDMVNIEVDGIAMQAPKGSMIIEATDKAGIEIPRFCYHPKLSISASCRMCLVDVEKMPKPVPACATPVMDGMKIYTDSRRAMDAQHGVMEFLLINHPLDCPICDQGGECELQDQAMGYGRSVSRFTERKRVVKDKNVGPLVQTEMTRCIHCTRCIRFLEEIAGTSEMGGAGRGDRLEIGTCVENSIDSELSGNVIDLCPVGALTNKPFRFAARAWELMAKPSVAAHDGVGSSLFYHVRRGEVLRCVPRQNEARNESWLSDRDRYSHLGLYADDRVAAPMLKENGDWKPVSWTEAIETVAGLLRKAGEDSGVLMSPSQATEEYFLAARLASQLGCPNIDFRLREANASGIPAPAGASFELGIGGISDCDSILLVGSNPREEAPIIGHRVRQAWRKGARVSAINPLDWSFVFETGPDRIVAPQFMVAEMAALCAAVEKVTGTAAPDQLRAVIDGSEPGEVHESLATNLKNASSGLLLLGQFAMSHPDAGWLRELSRYAAGATGCALNLLPHGANADGARRAGAAAGKSAAQMLAEPLNTYLLWGIEPEYDIDNPGRAMQSLQAAETVIAAATFATSSLKEIADVILPLAPLAEAAGSLVNLDGEDAGFAATTRPRGEARSGWKILRRLGEELGLEGFDQVDLAAVQAEMSSAAEGAANPDSAPRMESPKAADGLWRIGEVPMYSVDALCRRSDALQQTSQAQSMFVGLNPADAERLGLAEGATVNVDQGGPAAELAVRIDSRVPEGGAWIRSATCSTRELGAAVAPVNVEVKDV